MKYLIDIILLILLFIVVWQDFRERKISWLLLPLLFAVFVFADIQKSNFGNIASSFTINSGFILIQLLLLSIYFSLRNKKFTNIINTYIGIGDILFFIVICAAFSPVNFLLFYLLGLLLTIVGFLIYTSIMKRATAEIPLAGSMAALMMAFVLLKNVSGKIDFYSDATVTAWMGF